MLDYTVALIVASRFIEVTNLVQNYQIIHLLSQYNTAESIYKNVNWPSTDHLDDAAKAGQDDGDAKVDLYVWFGKDPDYWGTIGLAWVGTACVNYHKTSFNEWRKTPVENAYVRR